MRWGSFTLGVVFFFSCQHPDEEARPNVIIIMSDDQGYGDFSKFGNPVLKTPHLDQLHDEIAHHARTHFDDEPADDADRALVGGEHGPAARIGSRVGQTEPRQRARGRETGSAKDRAGHGHAS